ncbi:MAG: hypothetical protein R3F11_14755 [Verrucomicrobiales bacterium]
MVLIVLVFAAVGLIYKLRTGGEGDGGPSSPASGAAVPGENAPGRPLDFQYEVLLGGKLLENDNGNDGDSFRIDHRGREFRFRLYFVDTPETNDRYRSRVEDQAKYFGTSVDEALAVGREAKEYTLNLLRTRPFKVFTNWEKVMESDRIHAFVRVEMPSGQSRYLSELLVERGYARIHTNGAELPDKTSVEDYKGKLREIEARGRSRPKPGHGGSATIEPTPHGF